MTQVNIRLDDEVKANSEALFKRLGLTMSAAITLFLHQAINHQGLPFEVRDRAAVLPTEDPNAYHYEKLREASRFARANATRLTHEQIFNGMQELIDAGRVLHA